MISSGSDSSPFKVGNYGQVLSSDVVSVVFRLSTSSMFKKIDCAHGIRILA